MGGGRDGGAMVAVERRASSQHLARRVDLGLVLDQQPHNRPVAVLSSSVEARAPVLPGSRAAAVRAGGAMEETDGEDAVTE